MNVFFIIILVISVIFQIYKKIKEAQEESKAPRPTNYGQYTPKPDKPVADNRQGTPKKSSSIEEALEEMMRQAQERQRKAEQQFEIEEPEFELDSLGRPIDSIEHSTSRLDTPKSSTEPGKNYTFSDSLATSTLTDKIRKEQEKGILKKDEIGISRKSRKSAFGKISPREAFKYSILFERRYS